MVTQKSINFKIDINQLEKLDNICDVTGFNRNKVLNYCVLFAVSVIELQLEIGKSVHFLDDLK